MEDVAHFAIWQRKQRSGTCPEYEVTTRLLTKEQRQHGGSITREGSENLIFSDM
jgi:hypothetical protein